MDDFIKIPKFLLTFAGYWPKPKFRWSFLYNLHLLITTYALSYCYIITLTTDIYLNLNNPSILVTASYYCITIFAYNVKFTIFTVKRKKFLKMLNVLKDPLFNSDNPVHKAIAKSWSKLTIAYCTVYTICCYMCWVMYTFFPLIDNSNGIKLPVRGWFPYDTNSSILVFLLTYIFQSFGMFIAIAVNCSLDLLPSIFMNISCAQIELLKDNLKNAIYNAENKVRKYENISTKDNDLKDNNFKPLTKKAETALNIILRNCVVYHIFILEFLDEINNIFSMVLFTQILASGCSICITGLQLIVMNANKLETINVALYLLGITMQFSLYCWNGHHVIVQTSSIGDDCYNMDWYRCSTSVKKTLFIIMERCKKPIHLTAGFLFVLSIETMTAVLRNSYSYFAVLRSIYGE